MWRRTRRDHAEDWLGKDGGGGRVEEVVGVVVVVVVRVCLGVSVSSLAFGFPLPPDTVR